MLVLAFLGLVSTLAATPPQTVPSQNQPTHSLAKPQAIPAGRRADSLVVLTLRGHITRFVAVSVERRLAAAVVAGANAVVFDIDSTEAELGSVGDICQMIKSTSAPRTIAWINTRATGGAAAIALACEEIIVNDPATLGEVVSPMSNDNSSRGQSNLIAIKSQMLSEVVDSARRRGWDEYLVQALVVAGVELWQIESPSTGERVCVDEAEFRFLTGTEPPRFRAELITGRGPSPAGIPQIPANGAGGQGVPVLLPQPPSNPEAFRPASRSVAGIVQLVHPGKGTGGSALMGGLPSKRFTFTNADAGKWKPAGYVSNGSDAATVRTGQFVRFGFTSLTVKDETALRQAFGATSVRRLEMSWSERLAGVLDSPIARWIFTAILLIALFVEMTHPGTFVPGLIAAIALLLLLGPAFVAGMASWWAVAAIGAGIVLLVLELYVIPGFGVTGILGLALLFVGLVFTFVPGGTGGGLSSVESQDALLRGVVTVLLSAVTAIFGIFFVVRQLGAIPLFERYVLKDVSEEEGEDLIAGMVKRREVELFAGDEGIATTDLRPAGKAQFGDTIADVVAEIGYVNAGTRVRVVSAGRLRVIVDAIKDTEGVRAGPADGPELREA